MDQELKNQYPLTSGVLEPEWTPARVLTNFENRSGAGVDIFKEGPESIYEYEVNLSITDNYYRGLLCFFYKACKQSACL